MISHWRVYICVCAGTTRRIDVHLDVYGFFFRSQTEHSRRHCARKSSGSGRPHTGQIGFAACSRHILYVHTHMRRVTAVWRMLVRRFINIIFFFVPLVHTHTYDLPIYYAAYASIVMMTTTIINVLPLNARADFTTRATVADRQHHRPVSNRSRSEETRRSKRGRGVHLPPIPVYRAYYNVYV